MARGVARCRSKRAYATDRSVSDASEENGERTIKMFMSRNTLWTQATTRRATYFKLSAMQVRDDNTKMSSHAQETV